MFTMCKKIFLDAPNVGQIEKEYLIRAIEAGFVSTVGPFVPEFEEEFADYLGTKKAVSTQSGTAALHMALYELGVGKGDEVILPAITFVASINPILYAGAKPIVVDVDYYVCCQYKSNIICRGKTDSSRCRCRNMDNRYTTDAKSDYS
jgi:perosamine synthetase